MISFKNNNSLKTSIGSINAIFNNNYSALRSLFHSLDLVLLTFTFERSLIKAHFSPFLEQFLFA
jgi:hypothetical protein